MKGADFLAALQRAQAPLKNKVQLMIGRAIIAAATESGQIQENQVKVLAGESFDGVRRFQDFGFTSMPPEGTEAVVLALGGNRENLIIVATDHRAYRTLGLLPGESAMYTDDGTVMKFKKGGFVELVSATKVTVTCPLTEYIGNMTISGTLGVAGATTLSATLSVAGAATMAAISAAALTAAGAVAAATVTAAGVSIATIKSVFNAHTHPENGTGGGTTSVTTGPIP